MNMKARRFLVTMLAVMMLGAFAYTPGVQAADDGVNDSV